MATTPTTAPAVHLPKLPRIHLNHVHVHVPPAVYVVAVGVVVLAVCYAVLRHRAKLRARQVDRAVATARQHLGDKAVLDHHVFGHRPIAWQRGKLQMLRFRYDRDAHPEVQAKMAAAFTRQFATPVDLHFDHEQGYVRVDRRPSKPVLPSHAGHPALPVEADRLPFAVADGGEIISWNLVGAAPHALVIGPTGTGKTVALRGLVVEACRAGVDVDILDPKRASFRGLADWPGVGVVATEMGTMAALIDSVWTEMEVRYTAMKAGKRPSDLSLRLLVVDELSELVARFREVHDGKGEHPAIVQWRSLVRLGREARIHLLCGLQRPDAALIGGETRSNFGLAVGLGTLSPEAQRMIGATINVTDDCQGRAVVVAGRRQTEVQMWATPNPSDRLSKDERATLAALRPVLPEPLGALIAVNTARGQPAEAAVNVPLNAPVNKKVLPPPLAEEKVARIRDLRAQGATVRAVAAEVGVSIGVVQKYTSRDAKVAPAGGPGREGRC